MNRIPQLIKWLVVTLIALTLLTTLFFIRGQQLPDDLEVTSKGSTNEIKTLLVQFSSDDSSSGGLAILANEESNGLKIFNIPPKVVSLFGEAGIMPVARAGTQVPPNVIAQAISTATGIRIDGTLILQRLAVAGLVDSVGGVLIDSESGLLVSGENEAAKYVPPGLQILDGQHAAGYAMVKQITESDEKLQERMNEVLQAVLIKFPDDASKAEETLASLGSLAKSNISTAQVAQFLVSLQAENLLENVQFETVITDPSELEVMPGSNWLRVRQPDNWKFIAKVAPKSLIQFNETPMRIEVSAASATDRVAVANEVARLGFNFVDGGYQAAPDVTVIKTSPAVKIENVEMLREKLGLKDVPILWDFTLAGYADVRVVLGLDYHSLQSESGSLN